MLQFSFEWVIVSYMEHVPTTESYLKKVLRIGTSVVVNCKHLRLSRYKGSLADLPHGVSAVRNVLATSLTVEKYSASVL